MDADDISTATDTAYMARIGSSKSYLPGVSVRARPLGYVPPLADGNPPPPPTFCSLSSLPTME